MKRKEKALVVRQTQIAQGIYDLVLKTSLAKEAHAGQFVGVYPNNKSTILPRPISICDANPEESTLRLVYRVVGNGTSEFSSLKPGDEADLLGVLGNGYEKAGAFAEEILQAKEGQIVLMGGGIGIPPMVMLMKELKEKGYQPLMIAGYRDSALFLKEDLEKYGELVIATEDGSVGTKGNVFDAVEDLGITPKVIMACGPVPMLRAVKNYSAQKQIPDFISLEERMACGVGACLGCVCKTTKKDHHSHVNNARICTDGPVFMGEDVEI